MDRREFLNVSAVTAMSAVLPQSGVAAPASALEAPPTNAAWRTFDVVTEVEIWPQDVPAKVWLPLSLYGDTEYQRTLDVRWTGNPTAIGIYRDPRYGAPSFFAQWDGAASAPKLQVTNRVTTRNRSVDLSKPGAPQALSRDEMDLYVQPTSHIPTDGIVRATATRILPTASGTPVQRAHTLFGSWEMNWMAFNTASDTRLAPPMAKALGHFMYPYAETAKGALDYYNPQNFQYRMSATELKS